MSNVAYLPIVADRYGPLVRHLFVVGIDLTGIEMRAQVRLEGDTPGEPLVDLPTVMTDDDEGLCLVAVANTDGLPVSHVQILISEATMAGLPYAGAIGDAVQFRWDMQITINGRKRRFAKGEFEITGDGVTGADAAPVTRPQAYGRPVQPASSPWTSARLTFGEEQVTVTIDGADLLGGLAGQALVQANRAVSAAAAARNQVEALGGGLGTIDDAATDVIPIIADIAGSVVLGVNPETGRLVADLDDPTRAVSRAVSMTVGAAPAVFNDDQAQVVPLIADLAGNVVLGYEPASGSFVGAVLPAGGAASQGKVYPLSAGDRLTRLATGWNGYISYGQSLSLGARDATVISTTQAYGSKTFGSGPRAGKSPNGIGALNTSPGTSTVKPLVEDNVSPAADGQDVAGETPCSAFANGYVTLGLVRDGTPAAQNMWFASAAGHSGYSINSLNKSGAWYPQWLDHVSEAKARASEAGVPYALQIGSWMQGETDAENAMSRAAYAATLTQLFADQVADAEAITGQTTPVHFLTYQTAAAISAGKRAGVNAIALAQLDVAEANPLVHMVVPAYPFYIGSQDHLHLAALRTHLIGRYFARAARQIIEEQREPDRIRFLSAFAFGTTLAIRFDVPRGPLVLDGSTLGMTQDHGFKVADATGAVALSNIRVAADGVTVLATLARALGASPVIRYALDYLADGLLITSGSSGSLRDSTTDTQVVAGTTYPLWHWCAAFEKPITLGETI